MKKSILTVATLAGLALSGSALASGTYSTGFGKNIAIPDDSPAGASVTLTVPSDIGNGDLISTIAVGVSVIHTWQGDLTLTLTAPGGAASVVLLARPGEPQSFYGFSNDNLGVAGASYMNFTDTASAMYDDGALGAPVDNVAGDWLAEGGSLNTVLAGINAAGDWTLTVVDSAGGDTGVIDGLSMTVVTVPTPGSLALMGIGGLLAVRRRRA